MDTDLIPDWPELLASLSRGKYTSWTQGMDVARLEVILWVVGEFGGRFNALKEEMGFYGGPTFQRSGGAEFRMRGALDTLAQIQRGEAVRWHFPNRADCAYSDVRCPFGRGLRERLGRGECTAWAQDLDERGLFLVLWMVGEYVRRVGDDIPRFARDAGGPRPMVTALLLLRRLARPNTAAPSLDEVKTMLIRNPEVLVKEWERTD